MQRYYRPIGTCIEPSVTNMYLLPPVGKIGFYHAIMTDPLLAYYYIVFMLRRYSLQL